jgi:hypothetical protein
LSHACGITDADGDEADVNPIVAAWRLAKVVLKVR